MVRGKLARRHNLEEEEEEGSSSHQLRLEVPQLDWSSNQKLPPQNGGNSGQTF